MSGLERAQLEANQKGRKKNHHKDWESVRRKVLGTCTKENTSSQRLRRQDHEDSVDWDAVRLAQLGELAETIKERGMHHVLSGRIKVIHYVICLTISKNLMKYYIHCSVMLAWLNM